MLVPLLLQQVEESLIICCLHLCCHKAQVQGDGVDQAVVQLVAELVQHHVVRVAVKLLEAQATGVLLVDLVDGIVQGLPRLVGIVLVHLIGMPEWLDDELGAIRRAGHLGPCPLEMEQEQLGGESCWRPPTLLLGILEGRPTDGSLGQVLAIP